MKKNFIIVAFSVLLLVGFATCTPDPIVPQTPTNDTLIDTADEFWPLEDNSYPQCTVFMDDSLVLILDEQHFRKQPDREEYRFFLKGKRDDGPDSHVAIFVREHSLDAGNYTIYPYLDGTDYFEVGIQGPNGIQYTLYRSESGLMKVDRTENLDYKIMIRGTANSGCDQTIHDFLILFTGPIVEALPE